jgi:hypothetical protein
MATKFKKYTWSDGSKSKATAVFNGDMNKANAIAAKLEKQGYKVNITTHESGIITVSGKTDPKPSTFIHSSPCGDGCGISYGR